tara:strand:- start:14 stop:682 length:669 start_codon:yes stop_codon:yes gene_type:complete
MRIESKLCHISENKAVVLVNGWLNDENLGSALAEASTVELAEEKAISRLNKRLDLSNEKGIHIDNNVEAKIKTSVKVELPISEAKDKVNVNNEPTDWSNELTAIDLEIKRLNWTRDDEIKFLENSFGYNNRNKITEYSKLVNYLSLLKNESNFRLKTINTENFNRLIEESDLLLRELSWDNKKGREFLQNEFNVSKRKDLDENQLMLFIDKLKSIRNQYFSK